MKGTVDTFAVTMDLVQIKSRTDFEPYNYRGHYYYNKYQQPIAFYGEMNSVGNIVLHEFNWQDKDIFLKGKLDANGSFSGTWSDTSRQRTLPFSLKETYSDAAIALDFLNPLDSPCIDTLSAAGLLKADGIFADQFSADGVKFPILRC